MLLTHGSADDTARTRRRSRVATGALLVVSVFLLLRAYTGIHHDGILYAGDALTHLVGGKLHQDLYFLYGSQGRFTILPFLYAQLIAAFGLAGGTKLGLLLAWALYLFAAWMLLRRLVPTSLLFYSVVSVVLGWTLYGGRRVFGYSEAFLTARSFAEPTVLLAIACVASGRTVWALLLVGLALAFHPLVGLTGAVMVWILLARADRRWLWVVAPAAAAAIALALHPVAPFADMLQRYDPTWLGLVREANPQAFIGLWSLNDAGVIVFDLAVIWMLLRHPPGSSLVRLATTAAAVGVASVLVTFVAVDLGQSAFIAKLQLWRFLWLTQWVTMAVLPIVLRDQWQGGAHGRLVAALLAIGWMAPFSIAVGPLGLAALLVHHLRQRFVLSLPTVRLVVGIAALIGIVIAGQYELRLFKLADVFDESLPEMIGQAVAMNLVLLVIAVGVWRWGARAPRSALALAAVLLVFSAVVWDQRGPWTKRLESYPVGMNIWADYIEPDATVYWYRDLIAPWLLLGHGNYYTQQQGSGAVFSREMTFELNKRRRITAILDFQEQICRMMNNLSEKQGACEPDAEAVHTVCTEGGIDYVVLQSRLEGKAPTADYSTGIVENGYEKKFFLYRCSSLTK